MGEFFGFGEDLKHKHPPKPQTNQLGDRKRNQPANLNTALVTFFRLVSRSQESHLLVLMRRTST
jgi:hypothetical protein